MGGRWPGRCRPLLLERDAAAEGDAEHPGAQTVKLVPFLFFCIEVCQRRLLEQHTSASAL